MKLSILIPPVSFSIAGLADGYKRKQSAMLTNNYIKMATKWHTPRNWKKH